MKLLVRWAAALAFTIGGVGQAWAGPYSSVYVFGDSLVDSGNAYLGTGGAQASLANGYYAGRFSNGLNFADDLSLALTGAPTTPFLLGGNNVGVGGALAQTLPGETSPSFLAQIGLFASAGRVIPSSALVLVTFGGNDVRATATVGGAVSFGGADGNIQAALSALYGLGARNFVITGAPDIGLLPSAQPLGVIPGRLAELTSRSLQISDLLATDAAALRLKGGTSVAFFDLFTFEHNVLGSPTAYGLPATLDSTTPCQIVGGGSPQIANCTNALYFDGIHPTAQVHEAIADAIVGQLAAVPEPGAWTMLVIGFGVVGGALRAPRRIGARRARRLAV